MKRIIAILLSVVMLLTLPSCGSRSDSTPDETAAQDPRAAFDEQSKSALESSLVQGAVYSTVNGEELLSLAAGKADKTENIDNSADVVYTFASITKQFTAAAIMLLYEDGKLDLNDTIDKYFPAYTRGKDITVHLLLCMRSGIPDYVNNYDSPDGTYHNEDIAFDISGDNTAPENRAAIEDWVFSQELRFAPDSKYEYSNSNYLLLGEIIEQVSGKSYQEYLTEKFLKPLDMTTAGFCDTYSVEGAVIAKAYARGDGTDWTDYPGVRFGCGDLICTPKDLAKWGNALMNGKVVSDSSWQKMRTDYSPEDKEVVYGYGLSIEHVEDGLDIYYHTGHFSSYYSMLVMIPKMQYIGVTVSNHSDSTVTGLCPKLAKIYRNTLYTAS